MNQLTDTTKPENLYTGEFAQKCAQRQDALIHPPHNKK